MPVSLASLLRLSRAQAFCLHLTLSLLAFSSLVFVMMAFWFPGELFWLDGGWQGLKLVAMVDLVLGPALTLLLYKPGKPKLALDLSLIAFIQVAALAYGFSATYQQRVVAVVYADRAFNTLSSQANREADEQLIGLDKQPQKISALAGGPAPLLVTPAPGAGEFGSYLVELFNGYPEPHERSDQYVTVDAGRSTLKEGSMTLDSLDDVSRSTVVAALDTRRIVPESVELYRFKARYANGIVVYDPKRESIIDWVPVKPVPATATAGDPATSIAESPE